MSSNTIFTCILSTCPLFDAQVQYIPSLAGKTLYLTICALLLAGQITLDLIYRTWGFLIAIFFGLLLEIIGHVPRLQLHHDAFDHNACLMLVPFPHLSFLFQGVHYMVPCMLS